MNIKLSWYTLGSYDSTSKQVIPGDKVCPANGCTSIGVIQNISKRNTHAYSYSGKEYTILWLTGSKRGKVSKHPGNNLVSIRHYLAACQKNMDEVQALLDEANKFGL